MAPELNVPIADLLLMVKLLSVLIANEIYTSRLHLSHLWRHYLPKNQLTNALFAIMLSCLPVRVLPAVLRVNYKSLCCKVKS